MVTQAAPEAIVDQAKKKTLDDYQRMMITCFEKYYCVLKPGHWMTVEFHNSSGAVWNAIQEAIGRAGFIIVCVPSTKSKAPTVR